MWQFIKDYHYYRPEEKRAIMVLLTLIVLTISATIAYERMHTTPPVDEVALQTFADSLQQRQDSLATRRYRHNDNRRTTQAERPKSTRSYTTPRARADKPREPRDTVHSLLVDTFPRYEKIEKYAPGTVVDLNKTDTTELKKIPGIGSAIARMIVTYRSQLGGFYDVGQLADINLDVNQLLSWFSVNEADITKIAVNKSSVDRLRHHPYINFYQAKALVDHRRKHGDLHSLKPFVLYDEFSESDLERINHYLTFD